MHALRLNNVQLPGEFHDVSRFQLASPADFHLAIHLHLATLHKQLGLATRTDQPSQLEELVELDVSGGGWFGHYSAAAIEASGVMLKKFIMRFA